MKAMQCDRATDLIGAYLDQELDASSRQDVAVHLRDCPACRTLAGDFGRMGLQFARMGREPVPEHLTSRVSAAMAQAAQGVARPNVSSPRRWLDRRRLLPVAAAITACIMTAGGTAYLMTRGATMAAMERDVVSAHVRSLLQDSPLQVASSDQHTVKPWFAGRLDFAPNVKDLAAEGFPLAGARLDYVGERRVAALVYRRRLHVVNVFLGPSRDGAAHATREMAFQGYNVITWTKDGTTYWAVSDLNMNELRALPALL